MPLFIFLLLTILIGFFIFSVISFWNKRKLSKMCETCLEEDFEFKAICKKCLKEFSFTKGEFCEKFCQHR